MWPFASCVMSFECDFQWVSDGAAHGPWFVMKPATHPPTHQGADPDPDFKHGTIGKRFVVGLLLVLFVAMVVSLVSLMSGPRKRLPGAPNESDQAGPGN